ncbi:histone-like nucleoid-structuring protein Lsr2 [Kitasatospora purpeofusca]|uniref:Lsr2 family DNA-binding protein n=1 Tax=Kitasatospora purpeofusca TaxID=67352 RepID=UPI0035DAFBD8
MTAWLERNNPGVLAALGAPGSQEAIDRAELRMGLELPAQVRQWLLMNDVDAGGRTGRREGLVRRGCDVPVPGGHLLLGLEDIQRVYLHRLAVELTDPSEDPDCVFWRREWLPIAADRDGLYGTFLDTVEGTLGRWAEACVPAEGVYASLSAFFQQAADQLEGVSTGDWSGPGAPARTRALDEPRPEDEPIRRWARAHGVVVNDRGRVPSYIREAYEVSRG